MFANKVSSVNEEQLREIVHYGAVTAVKFLDEKHVLVGYGPFLRLLNINKATGSSVLIWQHRVFKRNKIHCISVSEDKSTAAVAGGRSFALVNLATQTFTEKAINEWIISIDNTKANELLILTSHNEVLHVEVTDSSSHFVIAQKTHCNEKSILYSGSIQRCSNGHIYVAAGTVMSGVLVWDLHSREILHNLTDHEGSIFAVKIDVDAQYIVSCSDDRSIKLYSFQSGRVLASGWGHGSRIWSLSFYEVTPTSVKIFSTGEDCSARLWSYDSNSNSNSNYDYDQVDLKQIKCFENCHEGKHVWSGDADNKYWQGLVTGGADGKVRFFNISDELTELVVFGSNELQESSGVPFEPKEIIKQFVQLPNIRGFVVITSFGKMYFYTQKMGWNFVEFPEEYSSLLQEFCILRSFVATSHVVVCSRSGDTLLLGFSEQSSKPIHLELISNTSPNSVKVINVLSWASADRLLLLLVSPAGKFPLLVKEFSIFNGSVSEEYTYELENCDPRAFTPTTIYFDELHRVLLVGSRHANLGIFSLKDRSPKSLQLIRKICPGDTVTSISKVHSTENHLIVAITVRDGVYMMMKLSESNNTFSPEIIHQNKFTKGILEGGYYENDELFLYGFRSGSFFVWNETQQIEIEQEPCGGAHRQWEYLKDYSENKSGFSFISNASLVSKVTLKLPSILSTGTHGREIRSLALCPRSESDGTRLLVSASEDASIKVGFVSNHREVSYKWTMNNHVSGLQTARFINEDYFATSAANEELILWKLNREVPNNIAVIEQARILTSEENPDLRVMDIASIECGNGFLIAAGFSNSQIKIFLYDKSKNTFSVVTQHIYSTFCILNVELMETKNGLMLIVGTTDGYVTIWDVSQYVGRWQSSHAVCELGSPLMKQQFHQSGVKALVVLPLDQGRWKVITGGDDNSLVSANLFVGPDESKLEIESSVENAASATITGITPLSGGSIAVTSVDQIVRKWNYKSGLECISATYTTVADTGCCVSGQFEEKNFVIVGGAGLSIFDV